MQLVSRVVIAVSFLLTAIISVVYFELKDEAHPLRGTTEIVVDNFDRSLSKESLYNAFSTVAVEQNTNIYKLSFDGTNSKDRVFFEFIGNPGRSEALAPGGKYVTFDPELRTVFRPSSHITTEDVRGRYIIDGSASSIESSIAALQSFRFQVSRWDQNFGSALWDTLSQSNLLTILTVVVLCCALVVAYSALNSAKAYAIKSLHGYPRWRIIAERLGVLAKTSTLLAFAILVATTIYLWQYNGLARFPALLMTLLVTFGLVLILLFAVESIAVWFALTQQTDQNLKGAKSDGRLLHFAYLAKFAVLATILTLIIGCVRAIILLGAMDQVSEKFKAMPDYLALSHSVAAGRIDGQEKRDLDAKIRELFDTFEKQDKALLVASNDLRPARDVQAGDEFPDLIVDNNFIHKNCIVDSFGSCIGNVHISDLEMVLLIPDSKKHQQSVIIERYVEFIAFQQRIQGTPVDSDAVKISVKNIRDGQDIFSYRVTDSLTKSFVRDPVILVSDARARLLSDDFYSAKSSSAEALFLDSMLLRDSLATAGIDTYLQYHYSIRDLSMQDIADVERASYSQLYGLVATIIAGTVIASFLAALYCTRNRKQIYVKELHGYSFWRRHSGLSLGLTLGCATVLVGLALGNPSLLHGRMGILAIGAVTADILITVGFIAVYETRSHNTWMKRE
ncbi:DUF1430 domain-containing protein [Nocardia sp. NPDC052316]|uniref:DUF1430 domain-containing protein n=1 Tax=Nocardia sp. NPDC052316 TaxID=3364329 RepID=UPI0037C72039